MVENKWTNTYGNSLETIFLVYKDVHMDVEEEEYWGELVQHLGSMVAGFLMKCQ